MNQDTRDLIRRLCTHAGMIMEDASLLAVTLPVSDDAAMLRAIARLESDAAAIASLIGASTSLLQRPADQA